LLRDITYEYKPHAQKLTQFYKFGVSFKKLLPLSKILKSVTRTAKRATAARARYNTVWASLKTLKASDRWPAVLAQPLP
jgi:hypothetical protein